MWWGIGYWVLGIRISLGCTAHLPAAHEFCVSRARSSFLRAIFSQVPTGSPDPVVMDDRRSPRVTGVSTSAI